MGTVRAAQLLKFKNAKAAFIAERPWLAMPICSGVIATWNNTKIIVDLCGDSKPEGYDLPDTYDGVEVKYRYNMTQENEVVLPQPMKEGDTVRCFIKTKAGKWEQVTEHVFKNKKFVMDDAGVEPRYSDTSITINETGQAEFTGTLPLAEFGQVCRFLAVNIPNGAFASGPIVTEPETLQIHRGNSKVLHVLKTGANWRKAA